MDHYEGFPPQFFDRTDAAPDREFYRPPQLVTYLDAGHGHRNGHPLPLPRNGDPQPMDSNTDQHRSLTHRHGLVESRWPDPKRWSMVCESRSLMGAASSLDAWGLVAERAVGSDAGCSRACRFGRRNHLSAAVA